MYSEKPLASVLIACSAEKTAQHLCDFLPLGRFSPVAVASSADEAKRLLVDTPFDIVIINTPLSDDFGVQLALDIAEENGTGVMLLVKNEMFEQVSYKVEDFGVLTIARPCSRQSLFQSMNLLIAARSRIKSLEKKAQTLEAKMQEIRLINRAKLILIDKLKMTEPQAHRYIEKTAMDSCIKRSEVAESIIKTYDN